MSALEMTMAVDKVGIGARSPGFSPPGVEWLSVSMVGRERRAGSAVPAEAGTPYFVHSHVEMRGLAEKRLDKPGLAGVFRRLAAPKP